MRGLQKRNLPIRAMHLSKPANQRRRHNDNEKAAEPSPEEEPRPLWWVDARQREVTSAAYSPATVTLSGVGE